MTSKLFNLFKNIILFFLISMSINLYASDKNQLKIEEFRNDGFEIKGVPVLEDGFWFINLEKGATFEVNDVGEIVNKTKIEFISCKYNAIGTTCFIP